MSKLSEHVSRIVPGSTVDFIGFNGDVRLSTVISKDFLFNQVGRRKSNPQLLRDLQDLVHDNFCKKFKVWS